MPAIFWLSCKWERKVIDRKGVVLSSFCDHGRCGVLAFQESALYGCRYNTLPSSD